VPEQDCPTRPVNIFGSPWDVELIALGFAGVSRFDDFQRQLGISRKVLSERLKMLVADGLLERRRYQRRPDRYDYGLTDMGRDLLPVLEAMTAWSARWRPAANAR
jgi:DNA-binding HxlR family transcriptional regulator